MTPLAGPLEESERAAAIELLSYSFPEDRDLAQRVKQASLERTFAVRQDKSLAAVVLWRAETMVWGGREVPIAIVGPGATAPRFRNRGLLADQQEGFLQAMRDVGCVLSGIETPLTRWHRRNGWGVASAVARFDSAPHLFTPTGVNRCGSAQPDPPIDDVRGIYSATAETRFGLLRRDAGAWQSHSFASEGELRRDRIGWHEPESGCTGYATYAHELGAGERLTLTVHELFATTSSAWLGMLSFLSAHNNVARLRWDAPTDNSLRHVVAEPRALEPQVCVDKMARVVDIASLELLAGENIDGLTLGVRDAQAPWNHGTWRIESADDGRYRLSISSADLDNAEVVTSASVLGPLFSGFLSPYEAANAGLVRCNETSALAKLASVTPMHPPYCPDTW